MMLLRQCALLALGLGLSIGQSAYAQPHYPQQSVNVIVPQAPGGTNDIVARIMAEEFSKDLKQNFIVLNKAGAGGNIGTALASREAADGHTILFTISSSQAINPALYSNPGFDPIADFDPVAAVGAVPNVLCVNADFPAQNLEEFIALIKAKPGHYQYASAGNGSLNHLLGSMLDQKGGVSMQHIPYKGVSAGMTDVIGGLVPAIFASLPSALPNIKAGKIRPLGVSTPERNPALADVPAIGEYIPGYAGELWIAMYVPKGTPKEIINALHQSTTRILAQENVQTRFAQLGIEMLHDGPQELDARLQRDMNMWAEVVAASGAQVN